MFDVIRFILKCVNKSYISAKHTANHGQHRRMFDAKMVYEWDLIDI